MAATGRKDPLIGRELGDGRYRILRLIGEGGMGRVYEGEQLTVGRSVAIKVLHEHWAREEKLLARFRREAESASLLSHQHTVMIHDSGESEDGLLYIVMELLRGESLLSLLERRGRLDAEQALFIMEQVAAALTAIHRQGLIHRDLKPENIQIEQREDHPDFVKVLDFSIVKILDAAEQLTLAGAVFGTPQYMSPEQVRGRDLDERTDLYAFGIILYQLLCGKTPFNGENPREIMMAHLTEERPPLPRACIEDQSEYELIESLIGRCLERDLQTRISSASELLQAVRALKERRLLTRAYEVSGSADTYLPTQGEISAQTSPTPEALAGAPLPAYLAASAGADSLETIGELRAELDDKTSQEARFSLLDTPITQGENVRLEPFPSAGALATGAEPSLLLHTAPSLSLPDTEVRSPSGRIILDGDLDLLEEESASLIPASRAPTMSRSRAAIVQPSFSYMHLENGTPKTETLSFPKAKRGRLLRWLILLGLLLGAAVALLFYQVPPTPQRHVAPLPEASSPMPNPPAPIAEEPLPAPPPPPAPTVAVEPKVAPERRPVSPPKRRGSTLKRSAAPAPMPSLPRDL